MSKLIYDLLWRFGSWPELVVPPRNADTAATVESVLLSIPTVDSCLDAPAEAHVGVEIRAVGAHSVEQPHQSEHQEC